ncbi:MAG TPA: aminoacyl-histidine dipeptidase [Phycisphaerae bacterium]|nr:aminoacyl-histidine dipeptidase [Phycisphaerae bacterium]
MTEFSPNINKVLNWFKEIVKIPRCSKHEEKMGQWLLDWAKEHSFDANKDAAGNVLIKVPATDGYENSPTVVIQGHQDMVCEKTPDSTHDFSNDPIELVFDGEWLTANKTTLGADNGIAIAIAQAMVLDDAVEHPPLELLFTVDEETGLTGANRLEPGFLEGKILLNVDSEDEGVFTIGCAGGNDVEITVPMEFEDAPGGLGAYRLKAGNMRGGHSGVEIHEQRANAIKALFRAIDLLAGKYKIRLADAKGGSAHNAIPRDAEALVLFADGDLQNIKDSLSEIEATIMAVFAKIDPNLTLTLEPAGAGAAKVLSAAGIKKATDVVLAMPHGVAGYSYVIEGLVETSNNLATIKFEDGNMVILSSQRSSKLSMLEDLSRKIESVAILAGGKAHHGEGYPPWEANWDSPLLARCKEVYKRKFGKEPVVEVIHAGLECGIIGDKYLGMDMISFGPTLKNPHSPDEKLKFGDIDKIWDLMVELFKEFK